MQETYGNLKLCAVTLTYLNMIFLWFIFDLREVNNRRKFDVNLIVTRMSFQFPNLFAIALYNGNLRESVIFLSV